MFSLLRPSDLGNRGGAFSLGSRRISIYGKANVLKLRVTSLTFTHNPYLITELRYGALRISISPSPLVRMMS